MAYNNKFYLGDYVREVEISELMDEKSDNKQWINAVNIKGETPLHIAARRRILDLFECMLPYYNDIEACDDQGNTVLHQLVDSSVESDEEHKQKRIDLLRIVISRGADINKINKHGSTSVHLAAKHCHIEMLKILEENGADFSLQTSDGETPLLLACKHMFKLRGTPDETEIIDFLMTHDCDVNAVDYEGYSALHYAIEWCSSKTVVKLLDCGIDVYCRTKEHKLTPLHLAVKRKNPTKMDYLIQAGASVNPDEIDNLTPLHLALLEGTKEIIERLIDYGSDINYPDAILQFTPLHLVVYQKRNDLFQLLIDKGADVNSTGESGFTPLHLSSMLGNVEFTKILIDNGANVNSRDQNDLTPLDLAIKKNYNPDGDIGDSLKGAKAIKYGKQRHLIVKLLTCEHCPTDEDYETVIRLLIDNGADVDVLTKYAESLIYMAVDTNNVNLVKILLEIKVDINFESSASDYTPLYLAISKNNKNVVEILINAGADVNHPTPDGKSLLHFALELNFMEIVKVLIDAGAKLNCNGKRCLYTVLYFIAESNDDALNDFEKTPLLLAIDRLDNTEIKKAVMSLCTLVSAGNENDCMAVSDYVKDNFMYNFKCLLKIGFDIDDYETFCKLVFRCMGDDGFTPFNTPPGLFGLVADIKSQDEDECRQEFENLKEYFIGENVSLYDFLQMKFKTSREYTNNLNLCEIESKFPIYYELILARFREDIIREALLETTQMAFCELTSIEFPMICIEEMFSNLEIINMISTIEAAELTN